jgi:ribonuclease Y
MDELFGTHTTDTLTTEQLPAFGILNYNRISLTVNSDIKTRAIINTREIAKKIEQELKYPGEIKVNIIRELRVIEYAR